MTGNAPADHMALRPGLTPGDIHRVEGILGFPLHHHVAEFLKLQGGMVEWKGYFIPPGYRLLGPLEIVWRHHGMMERVSEYQGSSAVGTIVHPLWMPLAGGVSADLLFVDHRPGPGYGGVCEWREGSPEFHPVWPNVGAMLTEIAEAMETGSQPSGRYIIGIKNSRIAWSTDRS
ncbi:SMI1/KNR4 family protein [Streptomyces capparidis]